MNPLTIKVNQLTDRVETISPDKTVYISEEIIHPDSSNIRFIAYEEDFQELYLVFKSGRAYCYVDVTLMEYKELLRRKSKGKYFNKTIRKTKVYYEL